MTTENNVSNHLYEYATGMFAGAALAMLPIALDFTKSIPSSSPLHFVAVPLTASALLHYTGAKEITMDFAAGELMGTAFAISKYMGQGSGNMDMNFHTNMQLLCYGAELLSACYVVKNLSEQLLEMYETYTAPQEHSDIEIATDWQV